MFFICFMHEDVGPLNEHNYSDLSSWVSKFILFFFLSLFVCLFVFWLCWVFVAARGLSLVVVSGVCPSLQCAGFSLRCLLFAEHGL